MRPSTAENRQSDLLLTIMNGRDVSRHVLARRLGLSFPSVTRIVELMISEGIVAENGKISRASRAGPRPMALSVRADLGYTIGVDVEGFMVRAVALDFGNGITSRCRIPLDLAGGIQAAAEATCDAVARMLASGLRRDAVLGIGLGLPGYVDPSDGVMRDWLGNRRMERLALGEIVKSRFALPVVVNKNVNCVALAESRIGPHAGEHSTLAVVLARFGVGCAFLVDGRLLNAGGRRGGELGHTVVEAGGRPCICGQRGCLEAYAGGWALARTLGGSGQTPAELYATLLDGLADPGSAERIRDALREGLRYLGLGLRNVVRLMGPDLTLVRGVYEILAGEAPDALAEQIGGEEDPPARVSLDGLGEYGGAIGAAMIARDRAAPAYFLERFFRGAKRRPSRRRGVLRA